MLIGAILAGMLVYFMISAMVAAIVWMFTTVIGLGLIALFILMVIVNFLAPDGDEEDEE